MVSNHKSLKKWDNMQNSNLEMHNLETTLKILPAQ